MKEKLQEYGLDDKGVALDTVYGSTSQNIAYLCVCYTL